MRGSDFNNFVDPGMYIFLAAGMVMGVIVWEGVQFLVRLIVA